MFMASVFPGPVFVGMHVGLPLVGVLMGMFMVMFVHVSVGMFMAVNGVSMLVLVGVNVGVFVSMQMLVFVSAFHFGFLLNPIRLPVFRRPI